MNILGTVNMKKPQREKSKIIGKNIAALRKSLEITQEDLAAFKERTKSRFYYD